MKREVETHTWVRNAVVKRRWPNVLVIGVDEHLPVARWGERQLLSAQATLFEVGSQQSYRHLPLFLASEDEVHESVEVYNYLQRALDGEFYSISELRGAVSREWSFTLNHSVQVALGSFHEGRRDQRIKRLVRMLDFVRGNSLEVHSIDLRYPNGVAVDFKQSEPIQVAQFGVSGS